MATQALKPSMPGAQKAIKKNKNKRRQKSARARLMRKIGGGGQSSMASPLISVRENGNGGRMGWHRKNSKVGHVAIADAADPVSLTETLMDQEDLQIRIRHTDGCVIDVDLDRVGGVSTSSNDHQLRDIQNSPKWKGSGDGFNSNWWTACFLAYQHLRHSGSIHPNYPPSLPADPNSNPPSLLEPPNPNPPSLLVAPNPNLHSLAPNHPTLAHLNLPSLDALNVDFVPDIVNPTQLHNINQQYMLGLQGNPHHN